MRKRANFSGLERSGPENFTIDPSGLRCSLRAVAPADAELLENLLELYVHDLSAIFPEVELGPRGRYGYAALPAYLSGSSDRFAFLLYVDGRVAGFVLAKRGSPASDDPRVLDVAEFFVLRRFRRQGVGRAAARQVWEQLRGSWTVRAVGRNPGAVAFWRQVVQGYTRGTARESERRDASGTWHVFSFDNSL